jgi:hypothetical protein
MSLSRRSFLAGVGAAGLSALAGCASAGGGAGSGGGNGTDTTAGGASPGGPADATTDTPENAPPTAEGTLALAHELGRLNDATLSGGPPKDGIPSIDDPTFEAADAVGDRLADDDVIFGLERNGVTKAYPQNVLVWHEICNDVIGDEPVSVTYCPLTGTVQGFLRGETTFGVSGRLVNSNLVMYDRATDSRWPQVLATAKSGPFAGQSLREFEITWTTWGRWREAHPETRVLTEETGHARNYNRDPYGGYDPASGYYANDDVLFSPLEESNRFPPKEVVIGTRSAGIHAFRKASLREAGAMTGDGVLAVYDPALDTAHLYSADDPGAWSWDGGEVTGPDGSFAPGELPLDRALSFDAMWFAWYGFYPGTEVHQ